MSRNTIQSAGLEYTLRRLTLLVILLAVILMFLAIGCSDDKSSDNDGDDGVPIAGALVVPPGWNGDWDIELTFGDCESDKIYAVEEYIYSLAAGDTMKIDICPILEACVGEARGDSIVFSCYDTIVDGTCTVLAVTELAIALEGDSLIGEGEWSITLQGDCSDGYYTAGCEDIVVNGTIAR